jgi:Flp pilus assembly protein TadD
VLVVSAACLYAFPTPTIWYAAVVLLHAVVGVIASFLLVPLLWRYLKAWSLGLRLAWLLFAAGAVIGCVLLFIGTARPQWNWMYLHIALSLAAITLLAAEWLHLRWPRNLWTKWPTRIGVGLFVLALSASAWSLREGRWAKQNRIENPGTPPSSMDGEGDGPKGLFFPSSAQTVDHQTIPGQFFMESESCRRCHQDIYKQWFSSAHHFSSFNNQWYRKSIEYMQDVAGTRPSKWCGGCHDPAVLYSGMMDTPIRQIVNRPEAQAGLGCVMCHSIAKVKSTMGQGDFVLEYPVLHDLAATKNPLVRAFHDFVIRLNPEAHRRVFLKPFMRAQTAEFCSTCHKVHLDVPVNHYRWIRGFNEYDNWQASGVSGQGARSFYYPPKPSQCADCHMPDVASKDDGNVNGMVHSHAFPGANTALPTANLDAEQLRRTTDFLKGAVTVDIFGISPAGKLKEAAAGQSDLSTTFAVGEEAETKVGPGGSSDAPSVSAPLNRMHAVVRRGDDVRVDVVVRTRKVGHFFPGGTVDAYDVWVELKATDDNGRVLFWSGQVEDDGHGPVEKGAHFYRSLLVDANANPINKRNAWAARSVVYVRLIPPGAADTVHYRLHVADNAGARIKLHARVCYRKFSWWNTHFSYAGMPDPADEGQFTPDFDDRRFVFSSDLTGVSGKIKQVPDLPIIAMAEDEAELTVAPRNAPAPGPNKVFHPSDWTRWNDYGIGLLLQGDLKGAQAAFQAITKFAPENPDGWVNLGRVAVQEGDTAEAQRVLERAISLAPNLARAHFFFAKVLRNEGNYDEAIKHLRLVLAQYPRDRVARNDMGRLLFLKRRYQEALGELKAVLAIDPEDLQAHYNLMLCYNGLGQEQLAESERKLYMRFKADEAAQAITGAYRRDHPQDNNERQAIHEHLSVPLTQNNAVLSARHPLPSVAAGK